MESISYEQFGVNFVTQVVTPERVGATIARLAGAEVKVGPMGAGPGGAASVTAIGKVGEIKPRIRLDREHLGFDLTIPITLQLDVRVAGASHRYSGFVGVPLRLAVRAVAPVVLIIDAEQILPGEVEVSLEADGIRARILQRLGNVDDEVRHAVADTVNDRMDSEEAKKVRVLDILHYVEIAWQP